MPYDDGGASLGKQTYPHTVAPSTNAPKQLSSLVAASIHVDAVVEWRARVAGVCIGLVFCGIGMPLAELVGIRGPAVLLVMLATGILAGVATWKFSAFVFETAGAVILAFIQPSGKSVPYQKAYSYEQSLIARGQLDEAFGAYEAALIANPNDPHLRGEMAEQCAAHAQTRRAAELFAELREMPGASARQRMYATQRLIDLLVGPLGDQGRAMKEMRRLIDAFPGTPEAAGARQALARLKQEQHDGKP